MEHGITLTGNIEIVNRKGQPVPSGESYFESMTESLMSNYQTLIDWKSESTDRQTICESGSFYDNLIHRFLSNFYNS